MLTVSRCSFRINTQSTYHAYHHNKEDGSADEKGSTPGWQVENRLAVILITGGTVARVSFQASSDEMSNNVVHIVKGNESEDSEFFIVDVDEDEGTK